MRFAVVLLFWTLGLFAAPPPGYYTAAEGKTGPALRTALHEIVRNHTVIPYSSGSTNTSHALRVLDEDPADSDNVILIYARRSEPKATFGLTTGWNREHLWPNSYGLSNRAPAYTDLFNLRAADYNVNSARGNKPFDDVFPGQPGYKKPAHAEAPLCATTSAAWEPPPEVKGDIARALFYMDVRYEGGASNEPDLILTDNLSAISSSTNLMGKLSTLLRWHEEDPVDDAERLRNELIFAHYQKNRNPFIDRPEWVLLVYRPEEYTAPILTLSFDSDAVVLTWPGAYTGAVVEVSETLTTGWVDAEFSPVLTNGQWRTEDPLTGSVRFYRLKLPEP